MGGYPCTQHTVTGTSKYRCVDYCPAPRFLADITVGESAAFERWVFGERSRWQHRLADICYQHAQFHVNNKNLPQAALAINVAIGYEPLREDIVQLAMQLAYQRADRAGAITYYESLQKALDDQLGVPPMPSTTALYHAIVTDQFEVAAPTIPIVSPNQPFVGRQAELIALHGLTWNGRVVVISGDAGIGKTRLASEYLRRSNALIIHATAFEGINIYPTMYSPRRYGRCCRHQRCCRSAKTQFWHLYGNENYAVCGPSYRG